MNVYVGNRLPSTYQEVEYIQSSGTQRIDTGLKPTDATFGFKGKVSMTALSGDWMLIGLMGVLDSGNSQHYVYGIGGYSSQWQTCNIMTYTSGWANSGSISLNTPYEFTFNYNSDRKLTVNGSDVKTGLTSDSYSYSKNWTLFCQTINSNQYSSTTYRRYASCKLYYFQIYQGTTLVRDFVPCYRKSDSVIGLYDLANNQFYTNSGTGTFSKGNDVTMTMMKNAYIGEYVEETYTIPSMSDSSGTRKNSFLLISKNGYTIKKVIMETTGSPNPSSNYGTYDLLLQNNSNTLGNGDQYIYSGQIGLNNNAKISYKFLSSSTGVNARANLSGLNHTGSNLTKFSFDSNNGNANINGTNNEYTISGTEKTIVQQILQSATVYAYISIVKATTTATTVTVIYEPN